MDGQFLEHLGESQKDRLWFQGAHKLFGMLIHIVVLEFAPDDVQGLKKRESGSSSCLGCSYTLLPWSLLRMWCNCWLAVISNVAMWLCCRVTLLSNMPSAKRPVNSARGIRRSTTGITGLWLRACPGVLPIDTSRMWCNCWLAVASLIMITHWPKSNVVSGRRI